MNNNICIDNKIEKILNLINKMNENIYFNEKIEINKKLKKLGAIIKMDDNKYYLYKLC